MQIMWARFYSRRFQQWKSEKGQCLKSWWEIRVSRCQQRPLDQAPKVPSLQYTEYNPSTHPHPLSNLKENSQREEYGEIINHWIASDQFKLNQPFTLPLKILQKSASNLPYQLCPWNNHTQTLQSSCSFLHKLAWMFLLLHICWWHFSWAPQTSWNALFTSLTPNTLPNTVSECFWVN